MLRKLLLIEDELPACQNSVRSYLTPLWGFECKRQAWKYINPENLLLGGAELVVLGGVAELGGAGKFFSWLRHHPIKAPTIAVLSPEMGSDLLRSASEIVDDFVFSPIRAEELHCRVNRMLGPAPVGSDELLARQKLKQELGLAHFVGEDPSFLRTINNIPGIAASSAPVLLQGETGTGKELCAQAIHSLSARHSGPFIPVECGAIPENLVENELFGHVRGAFTDAHTDQRGLAAMADGGTLFMDEVDSLPLGAQAKMLRFIQEGTYRPLGSPKFVRADIRLIAASNRDLEQLVRAGQFRADLYFRLDVLPLRLPPLRDRKSDISILATHFLRMLSPQGEHGEKKISPASVRLLESYDWPGNIRELYNVAQRAVAFCPGSQILPAHLGLPLTSKEPALDGDFRVARSRAIGNFERAYLSEILRRNHGNVTRAAQAAGKDRRVFGRLLKRYNINRHTYE